MQSTLLLNAGPVLLFSGCPLPNNTMNIVLYLALLFKAAVGQAVFI